MKTVLAFLAFILCTTSVASADTIARIGLRSDGVYVRAAGLDKTVSAIESFKDGSVTVEFNVSIVPGIMTVHREGVGTKYNVLERGTNFVHFMLERLPENDVAVVIIQVTPQTGGPK